MVGSFGEILQEAPYILEELIEEWEKHEAKVKNQLLVASLKLFFKVRPLFFFLRISLTSKQQRPKEMKPVLGKLFSKSVDDFSDPDVHDRAIFYYRLLSADVNTVCIPTSITEIAVQGGG